MFRNSPSLRNSASAAALCLMAGLVTACGQNGNGPVNPAPVDTSVQSAAEARAQATAGETARLNEWFEARYEEQLDFSPIAKTFQGIDEDQGQIDDYSEAGADLQYEWRKQTADDLKANFDRDLLTPEAQTSYDIWVYEYDAATRARAFRQNTYVFDQMSAIHGFFPQLLIAFHKVQDVEDMENYVSRIGGSARALDQLITRAKANAMAGTRPPRFSFDIVKEQAEDIITGYPFNGKADGKPSALWADAQGKVQKLVDDELLTEAEGEAMLEKVRAALVNQMKPAYRRLIAWLDKDVANTTDIATGVSALANGTDYYNERLAAMTTTDMTADEIHELGLAEVERLRAEMVKVKDRIGFEGELTEFFKYLREQTADETYFYPNTDEGRQGYIDDATAAIENIKGLLPDYFGILPKADLVVRRVEPFREQAGAPQHYFPGTPDGSRPGVYYAHLLDMSAMPKTELEVIAYHEGLPGHHMQISIAQELESVPTFRTQARSIAYSEGWALYSEILAKEMDGTYETDLSDFGRLGSEIWRAVRLVLDTGLHSKGWTEEEAVEYFLANAPITEDQARAEVRRYLVLPGQATAYKIGMIKIQQLRAMSEERLGDRFDIRSFHDAVLGGGAMPLAILERRIDDWIAEIEDGDGSDG